MGTFNMKQLWAILDGPDSPGEYLVGIRCDGVYDLIIRIVHTSICQDTLEQSHDEQALHS